MKLHEYQAKAIFSAAGMPVPEGGVAATPQEARDIAARLDRQVVVKVQVPIGGRGKAGGIQPADGPDAAAAVAERLLGSDIRGYKVERVLVEEAVEIGQEFYLGMTVDRDKQANVAILSPAGGMDVEEIAEHHPDKIGKLWIDAGLGLKDFHIRQLAARSGMDAADVREVAPFIRAVDKVLRNNDASLVEINPLARTADGRLIALDGKMEIDDNALFRRPDLVKLGAEEAADHPLEAEAAQYGFAYVKLEGHVGIIGNGAGLVMTTLDMIQRNGGQAANFLDIGGGAKAEVVRNALGVVLSDPDVRSVLINVFGGITRCDEVAKGLLEAMSGVDVKVPVVVRLVGTREEEGRRLLEGRDLVTAGSFQEAARKAVELAG